MRAGQTNTKLNLNKILWKIPVHLKVSYWELAGTMDSVRGKSELESINRVMQWILLDRGREHL